MRRASIVTVAVLAFVLGRPAAGRADTPGMEFSMAIVAATANILYTPAKVVTAVGGLAVGAMTGLLTGGDERAAYAIWVPAASGTYFLTAYNLEGREPIEFFGSDYADTPSAATGDVGGIYEAQYSR